MYVNNSAIVIWKRNFLENRSTNITLSSLCTILRPNCWLVQDWRNKFCSLFTHLWMGYFGPPVISFSCFRDPITYSNCWINSNSKMMILPGNIGGTSTRNPGFGYPQYYWGKMGWRQVEQGFFFLLFCQIWLFIKVEPTKGATELWKIIKYGKKNWWLDLQSVHFLTDGTTRQFRHASHLYWLNLRYILRKNNFNSCSATHLKNM